jgi:hypothetical protein
MIKNKFIKTALLGATGAIALSAQTAFAFGAMGGMSAGGISARVGGIGSGRLESIGSVAGGTRLGAITANRITLLPNGTMIVPAVTPRVRGVSPSNPQLEQLNSPPAVAPCTGTYCAP